MRKALESFKRLASPSKISINLQEDALRAAVLLDCYEHCKKNDISEPVPADVELFKSEYAGMTRTYLAPHVEAGIRAQLVKMFEALNTNTDFPHSLTVESSSIPAAGNGVFVKCSKDLVPGTIVALYPGRVYHKFELLNDKIVEALMPDENFMLMLRRDDNLIDPRNLDGVPSNPFAVGQFVNHCSANKQPNVYQLAFDYQDDVLGRKSHSFPKHLRPWIPNIYANKPSLITKMGNLGHYMKGIVFMATRPIKNGDELFFDYRLVDSPALPWPAWYEPSSTSSDAL